VGDTLGEAERGKDDVGIFTNPATADPIARRTSGRASTTRLVDVVLGVVAAPELPEEGHEEEPPHVGRGEKGGKQGDPEEDGVPGGERLEEDLVLAEEAGEGRDAGDGERADEERPEGPGDLLPEPAHLPHVLLARHRVDDRARAEEEEGLEEGVGVEVEDGHPERPHPRGEEHEAELAHRRVGQHPLDVVLDDGDRARHEGGRRPRHRHHQHRGLGLVVERADAGHEVDARGDHGRGVDERGDRGRALHGVGQPDVERDLRALPGRPTKRRSRRP